MWTGVEGVGSGKMGLPYSIAEVEDEDSSRLNITGHSSAILSETFIGAAIHARAGSDDFLLTLQLSSSGCVNAHARQPKKKRICIRGSRYASLVGTSAKFIATMMHYLTISWVTPARHNHLV